MLVIDDGKSILRQEDRTWIASVTAVLILVRRWQRRREEREERALPQVSSEDSKRDSKETVGTAAEYSKQGRNEFSNEAHKGIAALSDGL